MRDGENAVGVILGNGYFNPVIPGLLREYAADFIDTPRVLLDLVLEYEDGSRQRVVSDCTWKFTTGGPIRFNSVRAGETYDARRELGEWSSPGYKMESWKDAIAAEAPTGKLVNQNLPPVRRIAEIPAVSVVKKDEGYRFDIGVEATGWARLKVKGKPGQKITIRYPGSNRGIDLMVKLFTQENVTFDGRFTQVKNMTLSPKPVQQPHPPIWIGARGPKAIKRAAEMGYHLMATLGPDPAPLYQQQKKQSFRFAGDTLGRYEWTNDIPVAGTDELWEHDERNLPIRHTVASGTGDEAVFDAFRDEDGNIVLALDAVDSDGDGEREAEEYRYDGFGLLVAALDAVGGGAFA